MALAVFTPVSAPSGVAPLTVIGSDLYCVFDLEADDAVALEAAYGLPDVELGMSAERREVVLSGCIVGHESPHYECDGCRSPPPWTAALDAEPTRPTLWPTDDARGHQ